MPENKSLTVSVKYGVVAGLLYIGIVDLLYLIDPDLYGHVLYKKLPFFFVPIAMFLALKKKVQLESNVAFRFLTQAPFLVFVIAELIWA